QIGSSGSLGLGASTLDLQVRGAGSRLDFGAFATLGSGSASNASWTIADGAATTVAGVLTVGVVGFSQATPPRLTVTGAGSTLSAGTLTINRGTVSVLDGARVTVEGLNVGPTSGVGTKSLLVSGVDSRLIATGPVVVGRGLNAVTGPGVV